MCQEALHGLFGFSAAHSSMPVGMPQGKNANVVVLPPAAPPPWRHAAAWPRMEPHAASSCSACASAKAAEPSLLACLACAVICRQAGGIPACHQNGGLGMSMLEQPRLGCADCKDVILIHCVDRNGERVAECFT